MRIVGYGGAGSGRDCTPAASRRWSRYAASERPTAPARRLSTLGVPHRVLSAAQDSTEAEIVANAGQVAAPLPIVTNMAGRGTDIRLGAGVAELGGLVVVICERHDSRRVDRQLIGRCARQGDPGVVMEFVSPEDSAIRFLGPLWQKLMARWPQLTGIAIAYAQRLADSAQYARPFTTPAPRRAIVKDHGVCWRPRLIGKRRHSVVIASGLVFALSTGAHCETLATMQATLRASSGQTTSTNCRCPPRERWRMSMSSGLTR